MNTMSGSDDSGAPATLAAAFVRTVARYAHRPAIKPLGEPAWSYQDLEAQVKLAVAVMRRLDCRAGDRIAIFLPNRPQWPVLMYAAALLGLCVVPVNTRLRSGELAHVLRSATPKVLFTQARFLTNDFLLRLDEATGVCKPNHDEASALSHDEGLAQAAPRPEHVVVIDDCQHAGTIRYSDLRDAADPDTDLAALARQRSPDETLWLFFTSGTTSAPKGVLLSNRALAGIWEWTRLAGYGPQDRVLMTRPLFYVAGHFWCMLGPLLHGSLAVVGERFDAQEMMSLSAQERITVLSGNPLMLKTLVCDPAFDPAATAHVRVGYFGGTTVPLDDLKRITQAIPTATFMQVYGTTELGGFALSTRPGDSVEIVWETCGVPLNALEIKLVDAQTGEATAPGQVGMLIGRSPAFVDYLAVSAQERAQLITQDGWVRTGDLLRQRPDGRYLFVGRAKDLIKVGGENATAGEIESHLQSHPGVQLAAVIPFPDAQRGEVPLAFIECKPGALETINDLPRWCRERMAPFKVPRHFVPMDAADWPMTASGKIAKHLLIALANERIGS